MTASRLRVREGDGAEDVLSAEGDAFVLEDDASAFDAVLPFLDAPYQTGSDSGLPSFVDEVLLFESQGKKESHPFTLELMASLIAEEYTYMINHDRSGNTQ